MDEEKINKTKWQKIERISFGLIREGMPVSEIIAITFILVGIIVFSTIFIAAKYDSLNIWSSQHRDINDFGDFLGGAVGSLWTLAGTLLFYAALADQRKDLESQKEVIAMQIRETMNQTQEFKKQNETATEQKNEGTFFQLLRFQNEIVTSIVLEIQAVDFADGSTTIQKIYGRKSFVEYYDTYKRFFNTQFDTYAQGNLSNEVIQLVIDTSYDQFYEEYQSDLGHYFRNIFNILKFIDGLPISYRTFLLSLLLAQLSNYELALLFYHGLMSPNKEYKRLIEEYGILATVPDDEITGLCKKLYSPSAFGKTSFDDDEGDDFGFGMNLDGGFQEPVEDKISLKEVYGDDFGTNYESSSSVQSASSILLQEKLSEIYARNPKQVEQEDDSINSNPLLAKLQALQSKNTDSSDSSMNEDSILSKLSRIKRDTTSFDGGGEDYYSEGGLSSTPPKMLEESSEEDLESNILSKLSKLKSSQSNDDNDNDNPLLAKLKGLSSKPKDDTIDEYPDDNDNDNPLLAKLKGLSSKPKDDTIDEYPDDNDNDNPLLAKLKGLSSKPKDDTIDEYPDDNDNDNPLLAKLKGLSSKPKDDTIDEYPDDNDNDNPLLAKLKGLSSKPKDDTIDEYSDDNDSDNPLLAKLKGLSSKPKDDTIDEYPDDNDNDNPLLAKLKGLSSKPKDDTIDEYSDDNDSFLNSEDEEDSFGSFLVASEDEDELPNKISIKDKLKALKEDDSFLNEELDNDSFSNPLFGLVSDEIEEKSSDLHSSLENIKSFSDNLDDTEEDSESYFSRETNEELEAEFQKNSKNFMNKEILSSFEQNEDEASFFSSSSFDEEESNFNQEDSNEETESGFFTNFSEEEEVNTITEVNQEEELSKDILSSTKNILKRKQKKSTTIDDTMLSKEQETDEVQNDVKFIPKENSPKMKALSKFMNKKH
jgi:hypothetical protein